MKGSFSVIFSPNARQVEVPETTTQPQADEYQSLGQFYAAIADGRPTTYSI